MRCHSDIGALLNKLHHHGVRVFLRDGQPRFHKPWPSWDVCPEEIRPALRELKVRKAEVTQYLASKQEPQGRLWVPPIDAAKETHRLLETLAQKGWCLLECSTLGEKILVTLTEQTKVPREFADMACYSLAELETLGALDPSPEETRLIHQAKVAFQARLRSGGG